jgi:SAM-dependent methyltransferase
MKIKKNGSWVVGKNDSGHCYVEQMSDLILDLIRKDKPRLVYDFGCGYGEYLKDISTLGIEAIGFEAHPNRTRYKKIKKLDLSVPVVLEKSADISISLEVGEHIPVEFEQIFIDNICNNTLNTVILSWAIEGQPGDGHINCRNNDYIISEMTKRGFVFDPTILELRKSFDSDHWFQNTAMLFHKIP